jgi:ABC-type amino acid transport system permease subunit
LILVVGMLSGLGRVSRRAISTIAWLYVEIVRGILVLVGLGICSLPAPSRAQEALVQGREQLTGWGAITCPLGETISGSS